MSIIEIGSHRILIVISEVEQVRIPLNSNIVIIELEVEQVSLIVIIEEEPNIQWDSNCDQ